MPGRFSLNRAAKRWESQRAVGRALRLPVRDGQRRRVPASEKAGYKTAFQLEAKKPVPRRRCTLRRSIAVSTWSGAKLIQHLKKPLSSGNPLRLWEIRLANAFRPLASTGLGTGWPYMMQPRHCERWNPCWRSGRDQNDAQISQGGLAYMTRRCEESSSLVPALICTG